jgi:hypothetical protein
LEDIPQVDKIFERIFEADFIDFFYEWDAREEYDEELKAIKNTSYTRLESVKPMDENKVQTTHADKDEVDILTERNKGLSESNEELAKISMELQKKVNEYEVLFGTIKLAKRERIERCHNMVDKIMRCEDLDKKDLYNICDMLQELRDRLLIEEYGMNARVFYN